MRTTQFPACDRERSARCCPCFSGPEARRPIDLIVRRAHVTKPLLRSNEGVRDVASPAAALAGGVEAKIAGDDHVDVDGPRK